VSGNTFYTHIRWLGCVYCARPSKIFIFRKHNQKRIHPARGVDHPLFIQAMCRYVEKCSTSHPPHVSSTGMANSARAEGGNVHLPETLKFEKFVVMASGPLDRQKGTHQSLSKNEQHPHLFWACFHRRHRKSSVRSHTGATSPLLCPHQVKLTA
jgi:hypothetical protein